jgi:hypothetical protein
LVLLDHLGMELQLRHREYLARGRICNRRARCRLAILITIITGEGLSNTEYRKWSENNAAIRLLSSTFTRHRLQPKQNGNSIPGAQSSFKLSHAYMYYFRSYFSVLVEIHQDTHTLLQAFYFLTILMDTRFRQA